MTRLLVHWTSNSFKRCILSFWWITLIFDHFCWFRSVKHKFQGGIFKQFLISRNKSAFDLKMWPVIGLNELTSCAKFYPLLAWYIRDGFVNYPYDAILTELLVRSNWIFPSGLYWLKKQLAKNQLDHVTSMYFTDQGLKH